MSLTLEEATSLSCNCGLRAISFGGAGMILGDLLFPINHHALHSGAISLILFSGMTIGMLLFCIPACLKAGLCLKHHFNRLQIITIHTIGAITMFAGMMLAGDLASFHFMEETVFNSVVLNAAMIAGMGIGTSAGYLLSVTILNQSNQWFNAQT